MTLHCFAQTTVWGTAASLFLLRRAQTGSACAEYFYPITERNIIMSNEKRIGRVTIPTDLDAVPETLQLMERWGADALRDCDGTEFPRN